MRAASATSIPTGPSLATAARSRGTGSTRAPDTRRPGIVGGHSYRADNSRRRESMLIDCNTCTARGTGCADCVVTVLLGAPPGWQGVDPVVVPMAGRARPGVPEGTSDASAEAVAEDVVVPPPGVVVEFDE